MRELKEYVDELFQHQHQTPEITDLKEEILSNMIAKMEDLIAQGMSCELAITCAKESVSTIDVLIDGTQQTDVSKYRLECMQTILIMSIVFWIFSLPLLFTQYAVLTYVGLFLTIVFGLRYVYQRNQPSNIVAFLSISASKRRKNIVWIIWGLFFLVYVVTMLALTFGSNLWFGRALHIDGPYQMANIVVRFYVPLLTIMIPIMFSIFTKLLLNNRRG